MRDNPALDKNQGAQKALAPDPSVIILIPDLVYL